MPATPTFIPIVAGEPGLKTPMGTAKKPNYFVRHWRGELSLGVSYWVNSFLGIIALVALAAALAVWVSQSQSNYSIAGFWIGAWTCTLAVVIWQVIGVWRAATTHVSVTGRRFWARAAQVTVILG